MSDHPVEPQRDSEALQAAPQFDYPEPPMRGWDEEEEAGFDLRRTLIAIARRKFLVLFFTLIGVGAAFAAWKFTPVTYTAVGTLWVDSESREGAAAPVGLFEETPGYLRLFELPLVLGPVVMDLQLYLTVAPEYRAYFSELDVGERFLPGRYELTLLPEGGWRLVHVPSGTTDSGQFGQPMGTDFGIRFTPTGGELAAGTVIEFTLTPPFDAVEALREGLVKTTDPQGYYINVSYSGRDPERVAEVVNAVMASHIEVSSELSDNRLTRRQEELEKALRDAEQALAEAERALEAFRVETVVLPTEQATPVAPGLEMTRGTVFNNFFQMQFDLEATRRDRTRIAEVLDALPDTAIPVASLETIPAAAESRVLQQVLDELVTLRTTLNANRERYSDEFPPNQELISRIETITSETLPRILRGIVGALDAQETRLQAMLDEGASELSSIPSRTIEEQRLRRQVLIQEEQYSTLQAQTEAGRLAVASSVPAVSIIGDGAEVPSSPSDDRRLMYATAALLGGLLLGIGIAILLDRLDGRVRYPTQVDREIGLNILGTIPMVKKPSAFNRDDNHAVVLEAFRELRIALSFAFGSAGPLTITITSPSEGEGKTFISVNLAYAFAELGRRTVLVDGDTRRGDAHRMLGIERTPGLTDYLANRTTGEIIHPTSHEFLSFIPSGSRGGSSPELLASNRMGQFLGTLKRAYDVVIVDSPPLTGGGDALVLASLTGHMAIVLRSGSTDSELAADRVEALSRFPIRILGAILNDTDPSGFYGYYPTYLPSYLTREDKDAEAQRLVLPSGDEPTDDEE